MNEDSIVLLKSAVLILLAQWFVVTGQMLGLIACVILLFRVLFKFIKEYRTRGKS
jgi:hypothetical protein